MPASQTNTHLGVKDGKYAVYCLARCPGTRKALLSKVNLVADLYSLYVKDNKDGRNACKGTGWVFI